MKNRLLVISAVLVGLALIFTGCSGEDTMKQAKSSIAKIDSAAYISTTTIDLTEHKNGETTPMEIVIDGTRQFVTDTKEYSLHVKTTGSVNKEALSYIVLEDGSLVRYTNYPDGQWQKEELLNRLELMISTNSANTIEPYLLAATDLTPQGEGIFQGRNAVKYTGIIKGSSMETFNGLLAEISTDTFDLDRSDLKGLYKDADDIAIAFYLDKATSLPLGYDIDATDYVASLVKAAQDKGMTAEETQYTPEKYTVSVLVTGYNNIDRIELPPGAKAAKEIKN